MGALREHLTTATQPAGPVDPTFHPEWLAGVVNAVIDPMTVQAADGRLVFANLAAARASGFETPADMIAAAPATRISPFELFDEDGATVDPERLPGRVALRTGERQALTIRYRHRVTGEEHWSSISSVPVLDAGGRPEFAINIVHDVTDAKLLEHTLRGSEARSRLLAEATRDLDESLDLDQTVRTAMSIAVPHLADWATLDLVQPDGSIVRADIAVADPDRAEIADRMRPFTVERGAGRAGDRALQLQEPVFANMAPERLAGDPARPGLIEAIRELGTTSAMAVPLVARGRSEGVLFLAACDGSRTYLEADASYAMELGRRIALAVGNARLYAAEQAARRSAESVLADLAAQHVRAEFRARAAAVLASSLDYEETIARVAELAVPAVADWSSVDIVGETGDLEHLVIAHVDPDRVAEMQAVRAQLDAAGVPSQAATVIETRQAVVIEATEALVEESIRNLPKAATTPEVVEAIRSLAGATVIVAPLLAGGAALGAMTLAATGPGRRLSAADLPFVEELAERAAGAIQNARLFRDAKRFGTILDTVRDGVTIVDPATMRVTYANDAILEQLGRERHEVVGHHPPEWTEGLTLEDLREFVAPLLSGTMSARGKDVVRIRPDGTRVPVEIRWQTVSLPSRGLQLVSVSRDISERLETEQRLTELAVAEHARAAELNAIIKAIGEGLVVMDAKGRITLANPTAQELLEPLEDWTLDAILGRLEDPDGDARSAMTMPGHSATLRLRAPTMRWIEVRNYAVGEEPVPGGEHIVILRDVTEAREREAVRDAFVGILSHELRTPVTTIYAGAKVLSRNESRLEDEARAGIFDDIHAEAERLHRLVEDVVALTRFGEGALDIGSEPVLLQRIVPIVVRSEQTRWPSGRFEVDMAAGLPPVAGDATYVEQVVRNLLANAVKYAGVESTIRMEARAVEEEVQVRVLDDGPGFPTDEADRLFELYYRSPATSRQVSGSGIGLFVCARLLDAMGGRIWAANRPEGGAEFGFALRVMTEER